MGGLDVANMAAGEGGRRGDGGHNPEHPCNPSFIIQSQRLLPLIILFSAT
jgi:hypothetical protein